MFDVSKLMAFIRTGQKKGALSTRPAAVEVLNDIAGKEPVTLA